MYAAQQKSFFSKLVGIDGFVGFQKVPFKIVKVLSRFWTFFLLFRVSRISITLMTLYSASKLQEK